LAARRQDKKSEPGFALHVIPARNGIRYRASGIKYQDVRERRTDDQKKLSRDIRQLSAVLRLLWLTIAYSLGLEQSLTQLLALSRL
jgi:hypothetical protein